MAEWEEITGDGWWWRTRISDRQLDVYQQIIDGLWRMAHGPMLPDDECRELTATTAEAAKLEALAIVGEWARSLAVEAAELRGRMVGETMNAEASPWDFQTMIVCEICGNKRCPHATDAKRKCTGSNEPGQVPKEVENED